MSKVKDITGQRFNHLLVIHQVDNIKNKTAWLCKCDCGNDKIAVGNHLKTGHIQSCGCLGKKDLTGKTFGRLTAIKKDNNSIRTSYLCECDCGNKIIVTACNLISGNTKSCGQHQFKNIKGKKFGKLTVIEKSKSNENGTCWKCVCECGREIILPRSSLVSQNTMSCGKCDTILGFGDIHTWFINKIRRDSKSRNIFFNLTAEELHDLWNKQNKRCALTGIELNIPITIKDRNNDTASLDRINSNKGYTIDNVQFVHKNINFMKLNFSQIEFINYCKLVVDNYNRINFNINFSTKTKIDPLKKVVLDIDGVIANTSSKGEYRTAKPLWYGISQCNRLVEEGYYVILFTARYGERFPGRQYEIGYKELIDWLDKYNVKRSEVRMGKPASVIYGDDKAARIRGDSEEGWSEFWQEIDNLKNKDKYGNKL